MLRRSTHPIRIVTTVMALGLLAACQTIYSPVSPGNHTISDAVVVDPQRAWAKVNPVSTEAREVWTIDGPGLQTFNVWPEIEPGQPLIENPRGRLGGDQTESLVFTAGMQQTDVVDLVAAFLRSVNETDTTIVEVAPAQVGGQDGIRFTIDFTNRTGLEKRAIGQAAIRPNGALTLMVFEGARPFHFDSHAAVAEAVFQSARLR